jgi:molybdopterin synthase catalytic subunit/molybdopterin converting factor small subunit
MEVRILFFGMLKDALGRPGETLPLPEGAIVDDVLRHYANAVPKVKDLLPSLAVSVNQQYAGPEVRLRQNDEIGLLPPVSGGAGTRVARASVSLVREKIDSDAARESIQAPEDGAVVVFDGIVRNHTRGRRTLYLDYEAYEGMAQKRMEDLRREAVEQFKVREIIIQHRLGRLEIGETSVLIVVASAHRGPAFDACRWLIDTLKRTVPIWKKEYFEDGAVWADGEPFPDEIPTGRRTRMENPASK